ncbi:MAG: Fe-S-cluster containining protein [Myxococcota bacterium]
MRTLPEDRWSCQGCGSCCHGLQLGPVEPELIADLTARDIGAHWPPAAEGWLEQRDNATFLRHRDHDGACVFLQPDRRCFLHARFGAAAKPAFCRIFPLRLTASPAGLTTTIRPECSRYHQSHLDGAPITDAVDALAGVSVPTLQLHTVALLPDVPFPIADWPAAEQRLLDTLAAAPPGSPEAQVASLRGLLGLPAAGDPDRYRRAAAALCYALDAALAHTGAEGKTQRASLSLARSRLTQPPPPLSAPARRYVQLILRGHIASGDFQAYGSLAAGLGRVLLELLLARLSAPPTPELALAPLGSSLSQWLRLTANPSLHPLLRAAAPALVDLTRFAPRD